MSVLVEHEVAAEGDDRAECVRCRQRWCLRFGFGIEARWLEVEVGTRGRHRAIAHAGSPLVPVLQPRGGLDRLDVRPADQQ